MFLSLCKIVIEAVARRRLYDGGLFFFFFSWEEHGDMSLSSFDHFRYHLNFSFLFFLSGQLYPA